MFIGHYAVGFLSRRKNHLPSLAMMFIAVQLLDLLWPLFVLAGVESFTIEPGNTKMTPLSFNHYPYSHSLMMSIVWGAVLAAIYFLFTRNGRASLILVALVLSHWFLDFLTHRPDLQLSPFSETRVGLSLWNYPVIEMIFEYSLFIIGIIVYWFRNRPSRKISFWLLVIVFLGIHTMNIAGPPPPSIQAVAWSANLMWLFIIWAWWIERPVLVKAGG